MKSETQVLVIGGGVVGCSVLYHLTRAGWTDVMLVERLELAAGSSWHAAGEIHTINGNVYLADLQRYTVELYPELEKESGQDCGIHMTGGLQLADSPEWMDWLKMAHARGRYVGMETELISAREAAELFPLMNPDHFLGAMWGRHEGHVDPAGVTAAYARAAQIRGATVMRHTKVDALTQRPDGTWDVRTSRGTIHTEHVVNAGGLWGREVGRMAGLELPLMAMAHQYIITEPVPAVTEYRQEAGKELPIVVDFGGEIYMREESGGILMGTYEQDHRPWSPRETPWSFGIELLPPELDRIAPELEVGLARYPALAEAGIRTTVHGPFVFSPDGNPCIGPVKGLRNFWLAVGVMAGFCQGGGVGLALANWITEGDPGMDIWAMDAARFGDWATMAYTNAKVRENYSRRFKITFPNEELPAARPLHTSPLYDRYTQSNAVWGASFGLEVALWFQDPGKEPVEEITFRRSNAFEMVAAECAAVRNSVGITETSGFAKYRVEGEGAEAWLDRILTNRVPPPGRIALSPMLNHQGKLIGDFTLANLGDHFLLFGSGPAEDYHMRWFLSTLPGDGRVRVAPLGQTMVGLSIAGPASREVLASVTHRDVGPEAFRFLDIKAIDVGMIPTVTGRLTFTGDLGYEIWVGPENLRGLYELLKEAGEGYGIRNFGLRALDSLRLEKGFGTWAREYRPIYGPAEAGLSRFVALEKGDFIGREAARLERDTGPSRRLVTMVVHAGDADVVGDEPIWYNDQVVGWVTSGGFAHTVDCSVALGYVQADLTDPAASLQIEIIGDRRSAIVQPNPLFDPDGHRMRS
ncbi:MAG: GcvT family protein [Actinomycetia bacterium]|nr:GcvT family protein [Actinomycetes bacterium]